MNAHETPILRTFKTLYSTKALQMNHNIVIAMNTNHPTVGETNDDPLSSPELFTPKGTPRLIHLYPQYLRDASRNLKSYYS
jgi:hypothetical protein